MGWYIAQCIVSVIPTVMIIVILGFLIMDLPPGDYLTHDIQRLESQGYDGAREEAEVLRRRYTLDQPTYMRFLNWI